MLDPVSTVGAIAVAGIVALAIRDVPQARRAGHPWRGRLLVWASGLLLALTLILVKPVNPWLAWVVGIGCCLGISQGVALARREESLRRSTATAK